MLKTGDVQWLSGLLEGEGYFGAVGKGRAVTISVSTTDRDVAEKARVILGFPSLHVVQPRGVSKKTAYVTRSAGFRAAGWMMTLYSLMGQRRQEAIRTALSQWRKRPVINARKVACKNGHPFDEANTYKFTWTEKDRPGHRGGERAGRQCRQCRNDRVRTFEARKYADFIGPRRPSGRPRKQLEA